MAFVPISNISISFVPPLTTTQVLKDDPLVFNVTITPSGATATANSIQWSNAAASNAATVSFVKSNGGATVTMIPTTIGTILIRATVPNGTLSG